MAKRGRPKKMGKRTPSGQLSRAKPREVVFDQGTKRTQDKTSVYGADGSDAIGRAYVMGLLGDNAQELKALARKVWRAYWPMMQVGREKSCLGLDVHGMAANDDLLDRDERQHKIDRERKLTDTLRMLDRMGNQYRRAFDQLVIDINPDCGPDWLDALIWCKKHNRPATLAHEQTLARAIKALEAVANEW